MNTASSLGRALVLGVVLAATPAAAQAMKVHFIDVGQGSATLLEFACGAILVDAGGEHNDAFQSTPVLIDYLDQVFAGRPELDRTLDALVISHPHVDHTLGIDAVLNAFTVLNAVTNGYEEGNSARFQRRLQETIAEAEATEATDDDIGLTIAWQEQIPLEAGLVTEEIDPVDCDGVDPELRVLWGELRHNPGWPAADFRDQNNHSVVLRVSFGEASLLLPGDIEETAIPNLIDSYRQSGLLDVDVLLAAHHGSHNGTTEELLEAVTPDIAVISMGKPERELDWTAWQYGHPRRDAIDLLLAHVGGSRPDTTVRVADAQFSFRDLALSRAIYATGWDGTVVLEARADGTWTVLSPAGAGPDPFVAEDGPPINPGEIDINVATATELVSLPLIGEERAAAIIAYRETHGPFARVEDLDDVPGIGPVTINAIRNLITAG